MHIEFSQRLVDDVTHTLQRALTVNGIVNVPQLAEEIRLRNEQENVALEDIAAHLMAKAQLFRAAMEFDSAYSA